MWQKNEDEPHKPQVVICPFTKASKKAQGIHEDSGHRNFKEVMMELKKRYWFPRRSKINDKVLKICKHCQFHVKTNQQQDLPIKHVAQVKPFVKWGLDFVEPLRKTVHKDQFLVTAIHYGTRWG